VSQDADAGAIRQAYRERVKECHPDVTDDPAAREQFKRLTTARDVLADSDERETYDRLGHDSYLSQHVETDIWQTTSTTTESDSPSARTRAHGGQSGSAASGPTVSSTQTETDDQRKTATGSWSTQHWRERHRTHRQSEWSRADGGHTDEPWQRAPDAYMRADSSSTASSSSQQALFSILKRAGPWLLIYFALVVSALVTSWFLLGYVGPDPAGAIATGLFSLLLIAIVLLLSGVHILLKLV
jgi:curved DNA-binding protein CbpA